MQLKQTKRIISQMNRDFASRNSFCAGLRCDSYSVNTLVRLGLPLVLCVFLFVILIAVSLPVNAQNGPTISLSQTTGPAGKLIQITGSGYIPGGYEGSILIDGNIVETFDIPGSVFGGPSGGNFSIPFYIPLDLAEDTYVIEVCSLNPCATGEFEQRDGARFTVESTAPTIEGAIAYVYGGDARLADDYRSLLANLGYEFKVVPLDSVFSTDFSDFDLTIIGFDTGTVNQSSWGTNRNQAPHIASAGRPILGVGVGGALFFDAIQPSLGLNGAQTRTQTFAVTDDFTPASFYQQPYDVINVQRNRQLTLYEGNGVETVVLQPIQSTDRIAFSYAGTPQLFPTIAGEDCRVLWGYGGVPSQMTADGQSLFVNAVYNTMKRECLRGFAQVCTPLTAPQAIPAEQALLNFDTFGEKSIDAGNVLTTLYQDDFGVTFGQSDDNEVIASDAVQIPNSAPNVALNNSLNQNIGSDDIPLTINFTEPKSHVGFYYGSNGTLDADALISAYDVTGALLCEFVQNPVPDGLLGNFIGVTDPAASIARVSFDYGGEFAPEMIDDLTFAPYIAPEPPEPELPTCEIVERPEQIAERETIFFDFFDDIRLETGTVLTNQYADSNGVTFLENIASQVRTEVDVAQPPSEENVALNALPAGSTLNRSGPMVINFEENKNYIGFYYGAFSAFPDASLTLTAFDRAGEAFCQVKRTSIPSSQFTFLGIQDGDARIAKVAFEYDAPTGEMIDNLSYFPPAPAMPEPPEPPARPYRLSICREGINGCDPVEGAAVHAIANGESLGSFLTDEQGLIEVSKTISGNQVWAMVDVSNELSATMPISNTDRYSVLFTSEVTTITADMFDENNLITIPVTSGLPLMLYHAQVSSEWVLDIDPDYKTLLETRLISGSNYLYDFSDGQFALGNVTVYQDTEQWPTYADAPEKADVRLYANNNIRPQAEPGGVVSELISDTVNLSVGYRPGYILMGSEWNRYFQPPDDPKILDLHDEYFPDTPIEELAEDWSLAFAHEWGHYLLFLFDTYLKLVESDEETTVERVDSCKFSAMGWFYEEENRHLIHNQADWEPCKETIANTQLMRPEWDVITDWYPWAISPTTYITGPVAPPVQLTTVNFVTPSVNIEDIIEPTAFDLNYMDQDATANGASIQARGFVVRQDGRIIDQGAPAERSTEMELNGGQVGDRFCVIDINQNDEAVKQRYHFGCELLEKGDTELNLEKDVAWAPVIEPIPLSGQTWQVVMTGITNTLPLSITFYPEAEANPQSVVVETGVGAVATGTITLTEVTPAAYIEVIAKEDEDTEKNPARRAFVDFGIGGGSLAPGAYWGNHSPIYSPDGTVEFYRLKSVQLGNDEFVSVVRYLNTYPLPAGTVSSSIPYGIVAWPPTLVDQGLINFRVTGAGQLNTPNAEAANIGEDEGTKLVIHRWNGRKWDALEDTRFTDEPNGERLASANSAGSGVYIVLELPANQSPPVGSLYLPVIATK